MMIKTSRSGVGLLVRLLAIIHACSAQSMVEPPTKAPEDTIKDCTSWVVGTENDTCESLAEDNFVDLEDFVTWNPSLAKDCEILPGVSYCLEQNWSVPSAPPSPASRGDTPPPTEDAGNGIETPEDAMPDMAKDCEKFHLVKGSDSCDSIAAMYKIRKEDFYAWNPAVGKTCKTLWLDAYVCVGVIGGSETPEDKTTTKNGSGDATPTKPSNGIETPDEAMPDMTENCSKFHLVKANDNCESIAAKYKIRKEDFYAWNPAVGKTCKSLWLDSYVCVSIIGGSPPASQTTTRPATQPATPTRPPNGIETPAEAMPDIVPGCTRFHQVQPRDTCETIAKKYGVRLSDIIKWTPSVGSGCRSMWLDAYVCVKGP